MSVSRYFLGPRVPKFSKYIGCSVGISISDKQQIIFLTSMPRILHECPVFYLLTVTLASVQSRWPSDAGLCNNWCSQHPSFILPVHGSVLEAPGSHNVRVITATLG